MPREYTDDAHHLVRLVRPGHRARDGDGNVIGVTFAAFELRAGEAYLSTSCLEKAGAAGATKVALLSAVKACMTAKGFALKNTLLTVGNVAKIKQTFDPHRVRVTNEPKAWNAAYSAVRQLPAERQAALERLAREAWADWSTSDSVP